MSKFCDDVSTREEHESKATNFLTFQQLEILVDALIKETQEANVEFNQKGSFTVDQDIQTCSNRLELEKLNEDVEKCTSKLSLLEEAISINERTMLEITNDISKIEKLQNNVVLCNSVYESDLYVILKIVDSLNSQVAQARTDLDSTTEFLAIQKRFPSTNDAPTTIVSILNYQLDLLLFIERSLAHINENSEYIKEQIRSVRQSHSQVFDRGGF